MRSISTRRAFSLRQFRQIEGKSVGFVSAFVFFGPHIYIVFGQYSRNFSTI